MGLTPDTIQYVTIGDVSLEVSCTIGDASREPLVLLHEGLGCIELWKKFPSLLSARTGRRVITYSRQGYGRSAPFAQVRGIDYLHKEAIVVLPELLRQLEITNPVLFGHSDGASIALIFAGVYPDLPKAAIVLAPHLFVEPVTLAGIREVDENLKEKLIVRLARYHNNSEAVYFAWRDIWLKPEFRTWNIEDIVAEIRCPVLAIQGQKDQYGTLYQIERIKELHSETELLCLADCGHSPHQEKELEVLDSTCRFLERLA